MSIGTYVRFWGERFAPPWFEYSSCPSELKVTLGTISCILVITTLQLAPACQIKLQSSSILTWSSTFVFGKSSSSRLSKNEYLFRGISVLTTEEVPRSALRSAKPLFPLVRGEIFGTRVLEARSAMLRRVMSVYLPLQHGQVAW